LQDIVKAVNAIDKFIENKTKDDFLSDELLQSAILHKLTIIGEAVARISEETKKLYPNVEWKEITGFRNIVVHAYFSIDKEIIWSTAKNDLVELESEVKTILRNEYPNFELRKD
jgi:uncharacterized protein with HEPN domain